MATLVTSVTMATTAVAEGAAAAEVAATTAKKTFVLNEIASATEWMPGFLCKFLASCAVPAPKAGFGASAL